MKCLTTYFFFIILLYACLFSSSIAQESSDVNPENTNSDEVPQTETGEQAVATPITKSLPNAEEKRIQALKAQYPAADLTTLSTAAGEFTALWRKDRSGKAFGALLIVPADGQTANWPQIIDVLRTELPKTGWSTLSIDVEAQKLLSVPARPSIQAGTTPIAYETDPQDLAANPEQSAATESPSNDTAMMMEDKPEAKIPTKIPDPNQGRIEAAIAFLHKQGQYNIVLAGYGPSAKRVLEFTQNASPPAMQAGNKNSNPKMQAPVRAIVLVNPRSLKGLPIGEELAKLEYTDMPILDLIVGKHYLDELDATQRKDTARTVGLKKYMQLQMLEPNSTVFGKQNKLSRRVRGFLNKYAKGVEIGK